ncbi:MAG: PDZ domain-containing protein, partial [Hungatella sp.]
MENNKSRFWKGVLVGSLITAFAGLIIVGMSAGIFLIGQTVIDNQIQTQRASGSVNSNQSKDGLEVDRISAKMKQIQQMIHQYYLFDEDTKQVEDGIYMGLMYGLNDPYSVYYNEESYQAMQEDTSGTYSGIGAMVSQNSTTGVMTISKVFKGAPAYEAGMLPGDILYEVGGTSIVGMDMQLVISDHIRGEDGSFVKIKVLLKVPIRSLIIKNPPIMHNMFRSYVRQQVLTLKKP